MKTVQCCRAALVSSLLMLQAERLSAARAGPVAAANEKGDYVVLLHGLARSPVSMKRLERALTREGYRVINVSYPSTRSSIEDCAVFLADILEARLPDRSVKIHFATHSMGGIVLRQYLVGRPREKLGRVVMLGPPNQGSEVADKFKDNGLYQFLTGPAGQELRTDAGALPKRLGPADFELGVIAGDRSLNPIFSAWLPGPDDGKVSVASAKLEGMKDFLVVHHSHTWLPGRREVADAVVGFLTNGRFPQPNPQTGR